MKDIVGNCFLCEENSLHIVGELKSQIQQCISCGFTTTSLLAGSKDDNESFDKLSDYMKKWSVAEMVDIPEDERKNYPKETGDGYYDKRFDTDNTIVFDEFYLALTELNNKAKKVSNG